MKKFRFVGIESDKYLFDTGGRNPAICFVWDLKFPADKTNSIDFQVDWVENSRYSKGCRKKMLHRSLTSLMRRFVTHYKHIP